MALPLAILKSEYTPVISEEEKQERLKTHVVNLINKQIKNTIAVVNGNIQPVKVDLEGVFREGFSVESAQEIVSHFEAAGWEVTLLQPFLILS